MSLWPHLLPHPNFLGSLHGTTNKPLPYCTSPVMTHAEPVPKKMAPIDPDWVMCPSDPPRSRMLFSPVPEPSVRTEDPEWTTFRVLSKKEGFSGYRLVFLFVYLFGHMISQSPVWPHYVAGEDIEFLILLLQHFKYWNTDWFPQCWGWLCAYEATELHLSVCC